jgi:hypothetical protein
MKRCWQVRLPITQSEINEDMKTHFTSTKDVIKERLLLFDFNVFKNNGACFTAALDGEHTVVSLLSDIIVGGCTVSNVSVISIGVVCKHFDLNCSCRLCVSQSISVCINGSPVETIALTLFTALALEDWNKFSSIISSFTDGEEKWITSLSI